MLSSRQGISKVSVAQYDKRAGEALVCPGETRNASGMMNVSCALAAPTTVSRAETTTKAVERILTMVLRFLNVALRW